MLAIKVQGKNKFQAGINNHNYCRGVTSGGFGAGDLVSLDPGLGPGGAGFVVSKDPNSTCWMTGNLASTSALYILIKPAFTFDQEETALTFHSWFECSANGPTFT